MQTATIESAQVLVIDDDDISRNSVARLLRSAGMTVISAPSPLGASRAMVGSQVLVAVVDLSMPEMQGSSLIALLRKHPRLQGARFVLVSGQPVDVLVRAAMQSGADAAVSKLDMLETLVPTVKRLLKHAQRC